MGDDRVFEQSEASRVILTPFPRPLVSICEPPNGPLQFQCLVSMVKEAMVASPGPGFSPQCNVALLETHLSVYA